VSPSDISCDRGADTHNPQMIFSTHAELIEYGTALCTRRDINNVDRIK
jgi:hypothetical protein